MKFKSVEPNYTGGNIYVFTGKVDDNYFMADTANYDVRLLNADPSDNTDEERFGFPEWECDVWQEEHLVRDLEPTEAKEFFIKMLSWVKKHQPDGNYLVSDMDYYLAEVRSLEGDWR